MKKILFMMLALIVFVGCESEYDKMSEYEKMVSDVGVSSKISAEDALKITPVWQVAKIIYSPEPCGKGDVSVVDYEKETLYGGTRYYFSYSSKLRFYVYNGGILTIYDKGLDNPYYHYNSYYVDYDYKLCANNSFELNVGHQLEESWTNPIKTMHLAAYNENCIVIDVDFGAGSLYRYNTYVLKPTFMSDVERWETSNFIDVESFAKWKNENEK